MVDGLRHGPGIPGYLTHDLTYENIAEVVFLQEICDVIEMAIGPSDQFVIIAVMKAVLNSIYMD